jgi:hypothetical protein
MLSASAQGGRWLVCTAQADCSWNDTQHVGWESFFVLSHAAEETVTVAAGADASVAVNLSLDIPDFTEEGSIAIHDASFVTEAFQASWTGLFEQPTSTTPSVDVCF